MATSMPHGHHQESELPSKRLRPFLNRSMSRGNTKNQEHAPSTLLPISRARTLVKKRPGDQSSSPAPSHARGRSWSDQFSRPRKPGKCTSNRPSSAKAPPPFAEAFRHAMLHAKLEVPTSSPQLKKSRSVLGLGSSKLNTNEPPSDQVSAQLSRKASQANVRATSLAKKVFILTDDGCILQYTADGPSNRTPEILLELGSRSIAVASDAVPHQHWVLNVVHDKNAPLNEAKDSPKPSRPNLFSRWTSGPKRMVHSLLLVFSDDTIFNEWLICVRKEIESLGGLQYHPDSQRTTGATEPVHITIPPASTSPVYFRSAPFVHPLGTPLLQQHPPGISNTMSPLSAARSSVITNTELDRLRDSWYADEVSSKSGTRSSYAGSNNENTSYDTPGSDLGDRRPSKVVSNGRRRKEVPEPIIILPDTRRRSASCSASLTSPQFPRTPTLAVDLVDGMAGSLAPSTLPPSPLSQHLPDRSPFSFMDFFSNTPQRLSTATVVEPTRAETSDRHSVSGPDLLGDGTSHTSIHNSMMPSNHHTAAITPEETISSPPPPYSLAPHRNSSLSSVTQTAPASSSSHALTGLGISGYSEANKPTLSIDTTAQGNERVSRSRATSSVHSQRRKANPSTSGSTTHEPMGAASSAGGHSENPHSHPKPTLPPSSFHFPDNARVAEDKASLRRQQSMPNLLNKKKQPVAPPPSGPLPSLPRFEPEGIISRHRGCGSGSSRCSSGPSLAQRARSTTLEAPDTGNRSPLASNPPSMAELKYARRLSTAHGYPPEIALQEASPEISEQRQQNNHKSPPPSTWHVRNMSPRIASAPTSRRGSVLINPSLADDAVVVPQPVPDMTSFLRRTSENEIVSPLTASASAGAGAGTGASSRPRKRGSLSTIEVGGFAFPVYDGSS
jgi:hypothetical protein